MELSWVVWHKQTEQRLRAQTGDASPWCYKNSYDRLVKLLGESTVWPAEVVQEVHVKAMCRKVNSAACDEVSSRVLLKNVIEKVEVVGSAL